MSGRPLSHSISSLPRRLRTGVLTQGGREDHGTTSSVYRARTWKGVAGRACPSLSEAGVPIRLAKIRLDRANICHLWTDLELAGVTKLALFPSMDTAAEHVKWVMQAAKLTGSHESGG